ncbi:DUF4307 domain-containing protein [Paeniglutamicibacter sp. MACA_103]|uniref:DUF4307 domain-containing protein n=1 Tax=Paeniglutamicibacter sp. MACA_103 TaxID=3377337 RepID=UPI0038945747
MSSLTNRYGSPKRGLAKRTRATLIVGGVGLGVLGALYLTSTTTPGVQFKDISFDVPSSTMATATVAISKDASATVQCEVRALSESYAIVGWKTLVVGPTEGKGMTTKIFDVELRTESLATTAGVEECRVVKTA